MKSNTPLPEIIRFGRNVRLLLPELLPAGAVLILSGKHSVKRIENEILPQLGNRCVEIVSIPAELPLTEVEKSAALARKIKAVSIIGWGGGSAMDGAKAVAALTNAPLPAAEYFYGRAVAPARKNFLTLIPTTSGTGAEITSNAVLHDENTMIKQSLRAPGMCADAALVDPVLLENTPPEVMAASGFDALTQALESFVSRKADILTRQLALTGASLILANLEAGCRNDPSAFEALARGSMLTGIAFASSGLGAVHGIAHPAGSILRLSHGISCAILLVEVMKHNLPGARAIFEELASGLGFSTPEEMIGAISALRQKLSLPENFRHAGIEEKHFPFIVQNCRSGSMKCNPVELSDADVISLLEKLS